MTKNIKTDIRSLIFERLGELQKGPQTLKKFFVFSMDDLYKDYEGCIQVIEDYIEQHKDKILDFEFDSWIDESAMVPVILMKVQLVPSLESHLTNIKAINNLLPSSMEADLLRDEISDILYRYSWEFNNEESRNQILDNLRFKLGLETIEDHTTDKNVDDGILNFIVTKDGSEMNLNEYLELVAAEKRFEE